MPTERHHDRRAHPRRELGAGLRCALDAAALRTVRGPRLRSAPTRRPVLGTRSITPSPGAGAGLSTTNVPDRLAIRAAASAVSTGSSNCSSNDTGGMRSTPPRVRRLEGVSPLVRPRHDHDRVLARLLDQRKADPRAASSSMTTCVQSIALGRAGARGTVDRSRRLRAEPIIAVRAPAREAATAWLKPLPPRNISKLVADDGLPGDRSPRRTKREIHHEAADHADRAASCATHRRGFRDAHPAHRPGGAARKSSGPNSRPTIRAIASASPTTRLTVVDAVGTRSHGSHSRSTQASMTASATLHSCGGSAASRHRDHGIAAALEHAGRTATTSAVVPRLGEGDHDIAGHDHAGIAVQRIGGVHEERRRAGRGERRRQLAGDQIRTCPRPVNDHPPARAQQDVERTLELDPGVRTPGSPLVRSPPSPRSPPRAHDRAAGVQAIRPTRGRRERRAVGSGHRVRSGSDRPTGELVDPHLPRVVVALVRTTLLHEGAGSGSVATTSVVLAVVMWGVLL